MRIVVGLGDPLNQSCTTPVCVGCLAEAAGQGDFYDELVVLSSLPGPGSKAPTKAMKRRAQKQERQIAEDVGGKAQIASGSLPHAKGDVRMYGEYRIQAKTCRKKGYRLTREVLNKARADCGTGEQFALVLEFLTPGTQKTEEAVTIMDYHIWKRLVRKGSRAADKDR